MEAKFNYLVLILIIIVGVTTGNLITYWITNELTESEIERLSVEASNPVIEVPKLKTETLTERPEESTETVQQESSEPETTVTPEMTQSELIAQRRLDKDGIRLGKTCDEWRQADKDMNTLTSKRGVDKHCGDYELYLETGVVTPKY